MARVLLGSASPRRAELLAQLGVPFTRRAADIDETPRPGEDPMAYVARMAREKAAALGAADLPILTADTTVIIDGEPLGKPQTHREAQHMLRRLSAATHAVSTAVCVRRGDALRECLVTTQVEFAPLSGALIDAYLATEEPWDKAGAYAIQGLAGTFVRRVVGSVSNVIGLPLVETRELLEASGVATGLGAADGPGKDP